MQPSAPASGYADGGDDHTVDNEDAEVAQEVRVMSERLREAFATRKKKGGREDSCARGSSEGRVGAGQDGSSTLLA